MSLQTASDSNEVLKIALSDLLLVQRSGGLEWFGVLCSIHVLWIFMSFDTFHLVPCLIYPSLQFLPLPLMALEVCIHGKEWVSLSSQGCNLLIQNLLLFTLIYDLNSSDWLASGDFQSYLCNLNIPPQPITTHTSGETRRFIFPQSDRWFHQQLSVLFQHPDSSLYGALSVRASSGVLAGSSAPF